MRQSIELHPSASRDIEETVEWYNAKQEGLGYKFYLDFLAVYELISTYPRIAPKVYKENRRALLVSFPYGVLYQIQGVRVIIIAVLHTKRDSQSFIKRIET